MSQFIEAHPVLVVAVGFLLLVTFGHLWVMTYD